MVFSWFKKSSSTPDETPLFQAFILEPILTPSGLIDVGEDGIELDPEMALETLEVFEAAVEITDPLEVDLNDLEVLPFMETFDQSEGVEFTSGVFTVGETGEVTIDFVFDGGKYQGELAIFSLEGMEEFEPGSVDFIREAVARSLSDSEMGYVVISDRLEGARFSGELGEPDWNTGEYLGEKTFQMRPGDTFGVMLVPNGTVQRLAANPSAGGSLRPLFSLATANPDDGLNLGQIADVTGEGMTFAWEDARVDGKTDFDYNDIIFRVNGARGEAIHIEEVINPALDWRETELGRALIEYVTFDEPEISIVEGLPDPVRYSLERAVNPDSYSPETLVQNHQWVVGVTSQQLLPNLLTLVEAESLGTTRHIPNTYVWQFGEGVTSGEVLRQLDGLKGLEFAYPLVPRELELRGLLPDDTLLWHLHNPGGESVNINGAWAQGVTGTGVTIAIVDDGVAFNHPALSHNYRVDLSRNFTDSQGFGIYGNDASPGFWQAHGTEMAGIIGGNGYDDGLGDYKGAAPDASLVGLRLDPDSSNPTDLVKADTLSYLNHNIDIYNNSWGPLDNGSTLGAPDPLTQMVLYNGINQGRNGLGSIFVWAGGNGGQQDDGVNFDGYANSRYVIPVAAITREGVQAVYSESGAPLLISAYSSGDGHNIITTDLADYVDTGGTSAAAALTSGVVGLILEAHPSLTWRDVQHILVESARKNDPEDEGWTVNGGGFEHNYKYGFGALDAARAVELAKEWRETGKLVGREWMVTSGVIPVGEQIPENGDSVTSTVEIRENITLEKVEVMFDATHSNRGDLKVVLTSPSGTESILAQPRLKDTGNNFDKWIFTSARHWGESSVGDWTLQVFDENNNEITGELKQWKLNLYGYKPTISIVATNPDAKEGEHSGEFTITRTGNTQEALTVYYTIEGRNSISRPAATPNVDYFLTTENPDDNGNLIQSIDRATGNLAQGSVIIPAGESEVKITVQPVDDDLSEYREMVYLHLAEDQQEDGTEKKDEDKHYEVGTNDIAAVTIWDNNVPLVWLLSHWSSKYQDKGGVATEGSHNAMFKLRRMGDLDQELTVNYSITTEVTEQAFNDIFAPVYPGVSYDQFLTEIFHPAQLDDFTINPRNTRDVFTPNPDPNSMILGTGTVTFAAGQWESPWIDFSPINDDEVEPTEKVIIQIEPSNLQGDDSDVSYIVHPSYNRRQPNYIPIEILDNDSQPVIEMAVTQRASEDGTVGQVTFTRKGFLEGDLEIHYWDNGWWLKALPGIDYEVPEGGYITDAHGRPVVNGEFNQNNRLQGSIIIPDGEESVTLEIVPINNGLRDPNNKRVRIVLREDDAYSIGSRFSVELWIDDINKTEVQWVQQLGTNAFDLATGVAVDGAGYVYLTGRTAGALGDKDSDSPAIQLGDGFVAKYDPNGELTWVKQWGNDGFTEPNSIVVNPHTGDVYISGWTDGEDSMNGSRASFITKYNGSGEVQWTEFVGNKRISGQSSLNYDIASGKMTLGDDGFLYITGYTTGNLGGTVAGTADAWVAKYSPDGEQVWLRQLGASVGSSRWDEATGVAVDKAGNVYLTGHTQGAMKEQTHLGDKDGWLAKYDGEGNFQWVKQFGTMATDEVLGISVYDPNSGGDDHDPSLVRIHLAGYTRGWLGETLDRQKVNIYDWKDPVAVWAGVHGDMSGLGGTYHGQGDAWVAQFTGDGVSEWKRLLGTELADRATGVATDGEGNVYITGYTDGALGELHGEAGGRDGFVAMYNRDGAYQWAVQLGTVRNDVSHAIALGENAVYVAGVTSGVMPAGVNDHTEDNVHHGVGDAWVAKLGQSYLM
ncbi:S8 family serine peptidase [Spirulina subsalsa]|uniref:S8 family serine peptidase n=1 Tax=Spirulina subsalsa TaxID=54311 RepID=UPI00031ED462|nr:S8 family serine peptidase [Spirulina subsalsa]